MNRGLFIGRFQPFHLGHLSAIRQALSRCDRLIIGIGSSQYSGTTSNPLSADQREEIVRAGLRGIPEGRWEITRIPDIHDNDRWPAHVKGLVPSFDTLFIANDGIVMELFGKHSPETPVVMLERDLPISATQVREAIRGGKDWRSLVPETSAELIARHWATLS